MSPTFPNFLSSKPFEVHSYDKTFFAHGGALTTQLYSTGQVAEKSIDLSHWDSDTVERFLQFLYIGDYQVPEQTSKEEEEGGTCAQDEANTPDTIQGVANREELRATSANVLLVHAKVYALAEYRGFEALRTTALERLRMALRDIDGQMGLSAGMNVIELLDYVYSSKDFHESPGKPVQDLVSTFAADNMENLHLMDQREMEPLLSEGGDLAVKFVKRMVGRLYDAEGELYDLKRDVQGWKNRVITFAKKIRQSEAANAEKVQVLEETNAKVSQLEALNTKMRQSETANIEKAQVLEKTNAKMRQLEAINAGKVRLLQASNALKMQQLETKIQYLEVANSQKVQQLETQIRVLEMTNTAKIRRSEAANEQKIQLLETKMRQLEAANAEKVRKLEATNTKMRSEVDRDSAEKMRELETINAEKVQQLEVTSAEVLELEYTNAEMVQQLGTMSVKMRQLEIVNAEKVRKLERKVEWFEAVCPEKAKEYTVPWLLRLLNSPDKEDSVCSGSCET